MKKSIIGYPDFEKIHICVGQIIDAVDIVESAKLLRLKVDLGPEWGIVQIVSGIKQWYKPTQLIGNKFVFLANLEPKKLMSHDSAGMILACDIDNKAVLIKISKKNANGTVIR